MSFAGIESALIARLKEKVQAPGLVRAVYSAGDLAGLKEQGQMTPALYVGLSRYRVTDSVPDGSRAQISQTWLVVAVARNAVSGRGAGAAAALAREDAATVLDAVAPVLMGWRPGVAGCGPFRLADSPAPDVGEGYAYYPLAFSVETIIEGDSL